MKTVKTKTAAMRIPVPAATLLVLALAACSGERADRADVAATPDATDQAGSAAPPANTSPAQTQGPTTAPSPIAPPADGAQLARYDGYGDLRFGMTAAEAKQAWGGELNGEPGQGDTCYHLNPVSQATPAYFAFMIENDRFVRYDVGNDKEVAPGGGKRGMVADEIRALYVGRVEEQGHKYVEGGKNLRVKDNAGGSGVLVFETDATGKVTAWRAGVTPQVDYVEGCS